MQAGTKLHGFEVTRVREIEELGGRLVEMTHDKTGAQLCWLDRPEENKAFSIAFKTIPEDSTGVFHILEHSVLCGSDKYPVKEPFVELLKTSVQTFLNAMTFPDKTVYPFSSRNDKDYLNLMDIYLDAVFHPAIYHKSEIFRQEGWRYENLDTEPVYQGVVLNEMKGAFADPGTILENTMNQLLFPDNCYRFVSGGDPACIPDLSYEQFLAMHRTYYHPSNARISLVGSVDLDATLEKLDSFLRDYDRREEKFAIPEQAPVPACTVEVPYEIGTDEPTGQRTILSCGKLLGSFADRETLAAAQILADYLTGDHDAPLKRAILEAGLGQDVYVSVHDGIRQPWISWDVWNTDQEKLPAIRTIVWQTLDRLGQTGLDQARLEACYNRVAFQLRDRESGGLPRSLNEALTMLDTWLYDGDPAQALTADNVLASLSQKLQTEYYKDLMQALLLPSETSVTAVLVPSSTLGAAHAQAEAERLQTEQAGWDDAKKAALCTQAEVLRQWQQTPDSDAARASIPRLQLSDLRQSPEPLGAEETKLGKTTVLRHPTAEAICSLRLHFDASDLRQEELPLLPVLARLLGLAQTEAHNGEELQILVKQRIGRLNFQAGALPGKDTAHCRVLFTASLACLKEQTRGAAELAAEILRKTRFCDTTLLRTVLQQAHMEMQMAVTSSGNQFAMTHVSACQTAHGAARELLQGLGLAAWLKQSAVAGEDELKEMLTAIEKIAKQIFTKPRLTVSCSAHLDDEILTQLLAAFPEGGAVPEAASYPPLGRRQDGFSIPAAVGFAAKGTNGLVHGRRYHGSLPVLANVLNYQYLWNEIRVLGGAYGCGFLGRDSGELCFYTYRDPRPGRSLDVFDEAAAFLRTFCKGNPDLTGPILASVSNLDPLLNTESRISVAEGRFFRGISQEDVCRWYRQLLQATPEDLLDLLDALEELRADQTVCVLAGNDLLAQCGERLTENLTL